MSSFGVLLSVLFVCLPRGVVGWYEVCDCGILYSYSLAIFAVSVTNVCVGGGCVCVLNCVMCWFVILVLPGHNRLIGSTTYKSDNLSGVAITLQFVL